MTKITFTLKPPLGAKLWTVLLGATPSLEQEDTGGERDGSPLSQILGSHDSANRRIDQKQVTIPCQQGRQSLFWFVEGKEKKDFTITIKGEGLSIDEDAMKITKSIAVGQVFSAGHRYFVVKS